MFNSAIGDFSLRAFYGGGGGGIASPSVLQKIYIPRFDFNNKSHTWLAGLSEKAHKASKDNEIDALKLIEEEIDALVAQIWGLTREELKEIKLALEELN
jgi:hypothetical protein